MIETTPQTIVLRDSGTIYDQDHPECYSPPQDIKIPASRTELLDISLDDAPKTEGATIVGRSIVVTDQIETTPLTVIESESSRDIEEEAAVPVELVNEDNPEATSTADMSEDELRIMARRQKRVRRLTRIAMLAILLPEANLFLGQANAVFSDRGCPPDSPLEQKANTLESAQSIVSSMRFGITQEQYTSFAHKIDKADSREEIEAIVQRYYDQFGAKFHLNKVPGTGLPIPQSVAKKIRLTGHDEVNLKKLQSRSKALLKMMSTIPYSFLALLNGIDFYFAANPKLIDSSEGAADSWYASRVKLLGDDGGRLVINLDHNDETLAYTISHELQHVMQTRQCGSGVIGMSLLGFQPIGDYDEFSDINPDNQHYSHVYEKADVRLEQGEEAFKEGLVASPYGDFGPTEDAAETGALLLDGMYKKPLRKGDKKISDTQLAKQERLIRRQSLIESNIGTYYSYIAQVGRHYFPAENSRLTDPTDVCFGSGSDEHKKTILLPYPTSRAGIDRVLRTTFVGDEDKREHTIYQFGIDLSNVEGQEAKTDYITEVKDSVGNAVAIEEHLMIGENGMTHYDYDDIRFGSTVLGCAAVEL